MRRHRPAGGSEGEEAADLRPIADLAVAGGAPDDDGDGAGGGKGETGWGMVHVLAGYRLIGGRVRAVCRCGHAGPARMGEPSAAVALHRDHELDRLQCGRCDRVCAPDLPPRLPAAVGLVICPAVAGPVPDIEYLACAEDRDVCDRLAAVIQARWEESVVEADDYCRRWVARRRLRSRVRLLHGS